jgi:acetyl-CoA C-acetyltransferase
VLAVKAIHELHRTGGRFALVTMCVGGGQGIAAVFERL